MLCFIPGKCWERECCLAWPGDAGCKYHYQCLHVMEYKDEFWERLCVDVFEHHCLESVHAGFIAARDSGENNFT